MDITEVGTFIEILKQQKFRGKLELNFDGAGDIASIKKIEVFCQTAPDNPQMRHLGGSRKRC